MDEAGNGYILDKEGNVTKTTAAEAKVAASNKNTTADNTLHIQKEIIKEALRFYREEINLFLENNGKGPLVDALAIRLLEMPDCLPEDEEVLEAVLVKIEAYLEDSEVLLELLKETDANKARIEELTAKLTGNQPPYASRLSESEWDELLDMICPYLLPEEESSSEIVVVYNNRTYKDNESIYVFGETNEIVLAAASEETLEALSWEGASGNGFGATVDLSSVGEEGIAVKVNTPAKATTIKIVKVKNMVKLTSIDKNFAPTVESLDIAYEVKSDTLKHAKVEIFKNGDIRTQFI